MPFNVSFDVHQTAGDSMFSIECDFTCVKTRTQILLRIRKQLSDYFPLFPWIFFPSLLLLALLEQRNIITQITATKSFLQLNYAETRLGQLENCHCEKTCQVSGLLYRDQDSWVDGDNCRNCTCKVSPQLKSSLQDTGPLISVWLCYLVHSAASIILTPLY